ncbi:MAG: SIMPL domain-containing protein, partial [Sedimentisphaerales bacterium]|nr:SIMPL domain-containing protein [Sedimentisphaerales bacterium]
ILCLVALTCPHLLAADEQPRQRTITVIGEADVKVTPDKVVLTCGVKSWDKKLQSAKQKNNEALKKTFDICESLQIPKENIQTDYLSVYPEYESDWWSGKACKGFYVYNTFSITITDMTKLEDLITQLLEAGVNQIHDIRFMTSDLKKYREQARQMATAAAKEKAEKIAEVLDQKIGIPLEITENTIRGDIGAGDRYYRNANVMAQVQTSLNVNSTLESLSETVALGKITVRASVKIIFTLESKSS